MTTAHDQEPVIVITRTFNAPRALVFKAWTEPERMAIWWGPHGFTNANVEMDVRPGGIWRIDMCAPDGTVYPCKGTYLEVVEPERLVYKSEAIESDVWGAEGQPPTAVHTVTFEEHDGRTTLTLHLRLDSLEERDRMLKMQFTEGMGQSLERLEAHLAA
ncbi:SRPBCC domain-containing protein [Gloeobacter kilaueensis]|uniref:Activator of Hsp90 ATPase homologue 1/2-like C-terminal domain-containing protein n=1 Tax=Gloeobacter kilaueensis (strain ATCC BAA-2537 / CCAP 1431/1 / ULC 316 / JS1) TaxID=1183438 RepID=U5QRN7_GLOK1|nr:SRPBCC domain-containing protein [Gloeobacter kilaueensis]AGY60345.1 hypothetical protein GKIL_4099 [Gloeobacter kilaueensis JS1]